MWKTTMYDTTKLTVELREIVDSGVDIWDFDYPSYYEGSERMAFEQKVIDHYYLRQIGSETVGRWLHNFRTRMKEIMPYYIQLYKSQALMDSIDDPFGNVDIKETFEQTSTGSSSSQGSGTQTGNAQHKFSNTPQGSIDNLDTYMTEASKDDSNQTTTSTDSSTSNGTVKHTYTKKGNQGVNTYAHDMKELRGTFLNIDMMIINELKDLFLQIY